MLHNITTVSSEDFISRDILEAISQVGPCSKSGLQCLVTIISYQHEDEMHVLKITQPSTSAVAMLSKRVRWEVSDNPCLCFASGSRWAPPPPPSTIYHSLHYTLTPPTIYQCITRSPILLEMYMKLQTMSDFRQGTGVWEYPSIIRHADNQIGVCWSKHIILSLKTDDMRGGLEIASDKSDCQ